MDRHLLFAAAALAAFPVSAGARHDDDPKLLDRRPPYESAPFGAGVQLDDEGNPVLDVPPVFFPSQGMTLLSWLPIAEFGTEHSNANDCWGYVSPSGREYAIVGLYAGTGFVDITSPGNPEVIEVIDGPLSLWRDIKVYGEYAYAVSEGGGGIQVISLESIDSGVVTKLGNFLDGGLKKSHNVAIDTDSGFLYRCGGGQNGLRIYDLANPADPDLVGDWKDRYVHDAQVVTFHEGPFAGKQIAFCCTGFDGGFVQPGVHVLDVTDKQNIVELGFTQYPSPRYSHQCWLSPDRQYLYLNDELDEAGWGSTATHIFDVSDLTNPVETGVFLGPAGAIGHNLYTRDDGLLFEANYTSGLRVMDIAEPESPVEVAYFDTWPANDQQTFNGLWSVYPFFPSGTVIGSDIEKGLFVWWYGDPLIDFAFPFGLPVAVDPAGQEISVDVLELTPGELVGGSVQLHYDTGSGFVAVPMADAGSGRYEAQLPAAACGQPVSWFVSAQSQNDVVWRAPQGAPVTGVHATAALAETEIFFDDVEAGNENWVIGAADDNSVGGVWIRTDPEGTDAQPGTDVSPDGIYCFVTGNSGPGAAIGANDVDSGKTTLHSKVVDVSDAAQALISYWRWYSNDEGGAVDDSLRIDVSDDGGQSWVNVETLGPGHPESSGGWFFHSFEVTDFAALTDEVQLRFVASDFGSPSIVEAGVDDFRVTQVFCDALTGDVSDLSVSAGGAQQLTLSAGPSLAGKLYWLAGTFSGTSPGVPLAGFTLPLNPDAYFNLTLSGPNTPPLTQSLGNLDELGTAQASFALDPGSNPALAGLTLHHAYFVADEGEAQVLDVSNAVELSLEP